MRISLDIDEDVLIALRVLARERGLSIGDVLSELARQTLTRRAVSPVRQEVRLFPIRPGADVVTLELVNQLRDEAP